MLDLQDFTHQPSPREWRFWMSMSVSIGSEWSVRNPPKFNQRWRNAWEKVFCGFGRWTPVAQCWILVYWIAQDTPKQAQTQSV